MDLSQEELDELVASAFECSRYAVNEIVLEVGGVHDHEALVLAFMLGSFTAMKSISDEPDEALATSVVVQTVLKQAISSHPYMNKSEKSHVIP